MTAITPSDWIGRSETVHDHVAREPFDRLSAVLASPFLPRQEAQAFAEPAPQEFGKFVTCRLGTLVVDAVIMYVGGNMAGPALVAAGTLSEAHLGLWGTGVKVFSNVVVVVLNYVFSKLIIFTKKH